MGERALRFCPCVRVICEGKKQRKRADEYGITTGSWHVGKTMCPV